jgi:hypothetical protein
MLFLKCFIVTVAFAFNFFENLKFRIEINFRDCEKKQSLPKLTFRRFLGPIGLFERLVSSSSSERSQKLIRSRKLNELSSGEIILEVVLVSIDEPLFLKCGVFVGKNEDEVL